MFEHESMVTPPTDAGTAMPPGELDLLHPPHHFFPAGASKNTPPASALVSSS
jgi:hypothetical protein